MAKIYHLLDEAEPFSEVQRRSHLQVGRECPERWDETYLPIIRRLLGLPANRLFRLPNGICVIRFIRRYTDRPG